MNGESPRPLDAPARSRSERLRDGSHLIGLLADQLEALEQGDLPRLRELDALRVRLAAEMEPGPDEGESLLHSLLRRVEEAHRTVDEWIEADRAQRDEISQLRDGSLPLVRGMQRRPGSGSYLSLDPGGASLDVRL